MRRDLSARANLRAATADAHRRVDELFSRFDLSRRAGYAAFLQSQAAALLPLERALDAGIAPKLPVEWAARRRSPALLADLATWSLPIPEADELAPIERPAEALGTIYVLEGSRVGGSLLKRSVAGDFPAAFLSPGPSARWRSLLDGLERDLATAESQAEAAAAARRAFALFELAGARPSLRND